MEAQAGPVGVAAVAEEARAALGAAGAGAGAGAAEETTTSTPPSGGCCAPLVGAPEGPAQRRPPDLPSDVLKVIARQAVEPARPGNRLLLLLAMAGVCKQWRELARDVPADLPIAFDGSADNSLMGGTPFRFRRCALSKKEGTFIAGASLLRGERERRKRARGRRGSHHPRFFLSGARFPLFARASSNGLVATRPSRAMQARAQIGEEPTQATRARLVEARARRRRRAGARERRGALYPLARRSANARALPQPPPPPPRPPSCFF
jgi:hypothetical protein